MARNIDTTGNAADWWQDCSLVGSVLSDWVGTSLRWRCSSSRTGNDLLESLVYPPIAVPGYDIGPTTQTIHILLGGHVV